MIIYTATNQKTGQFYIGSARSYCRYMARKGTHHVVGEGRGFTNFQRDLQADPHSFTWEWHDDGRDDRATEKDLIALYRDSKYLYNVGEGRGGGRKEGTVLSDETKTKMSVSASLPSANPPHKKEAQRRTGKALQATKSPCPDCGMMLSPGNMAKHRNGKRCPGRSM